MHTVRAYVITAERFCAFLMDHIGGGIGADEIRDRGMLLARTGRVDEAREDLERYLDCTPDAPDAVRVRLLIDDLACLHRLDPRISPALRTRKSR